MPMNRRTWLHAVLSTGLAWGTGRRTRADDSPPIAAAAARGRAFLAGLFDPQLELLPEYRGATTYWLFHDNYLAAKVLAPSHPALAQRIAGAIHRRGVTESGKIEILFGEAKQPLPFRQFRLTEVHRQEDKLIKTEVAGATELVGWQEYADLLFLAAIALANTDAPQARRHYDAGMATWNGRGFHDRVAETSAQYATYKLALCLLTAERLRISCEFRQAVLERLLRQQADDGGWITDYDAQGRPRGLANVETTSLAILALDALTPAG
jgi:hypothetical protein